MNRIKSIPAVLLALILATGSLQGPVYAAAAGRSGTVGTAAETGSVDPTKVTQTDPLKLQPEEKKVTSISLSEVRLSMNPGNTVDLTVTVLPADADNKSVTWSSSNTEVATVSADGTVTAVSTGTAVITAAAADGSGISASCNVTVTTTQLVTSISLSETRLSLEKGDSETLTAEVGPSDADNKSVTWSSSNTEVATVDANGTVTAVGKGTAVITAAAADGSGIFATCDVTVTFVQPVTGISLNKTRLSLEKGDSETLTAEVGPSDADNKSVTWSSSNTEVATVDSNGTVTAVGKGTAVITATAADGSGIFATCDVTVTFVQPVTSISLNETRLSLEKGDSETLTAEVGPSDADNKSVTWSSSNTEVATVDSNGTVTAVGKGTAVITAAAADGSGIFATCDVTVKQPVTGISLNKTTLSLVKGKTAVLSATVNPANADNKSVTWSSSNTAVAKVGTDGTVTAVAKGTAVITAAAKDGSGKKAACNVTVSQPVTKLTLSKTSLSLKKGTSAVLKAQAEPSNANNKSVTWSSSNKAVATVAADGTVKAVAKGTAVITAAAKDGSGKKATCNVTVIQPVTSVTLNKTSLTLNRGKSAALKATVSPSTANNKSIKWTTSNSKVATVSPQGVVKGINKGTVTITATAADGSGKKATCKVTVIQPVTKLTINSSKLTLKLNKTAVLKVTVSPSTANNKSIKWTTSNKKVATVTSKGVVKGVGKGKATIKAAAQDGSGKTVTCIVTVK